MFKLRDARVRSEMEQSESRFALNNTALMSDQIIRVNWFDPFFAINFHSPVMV